MNVSTLHGEAPFHPRSRSGPRGLDGGELIAERPEAVPNPAVEVRQLLADGSEIKAIWSDVVSLDIAKLVTIHFFDE